MIKTIFFDLDGTLTPMFGDDFTKSYFTQITKVFVPLGYEPKDLMKWIWLGSEQMQKNDGTRTNHDVFWDMMCKVSGKDVKKDIPAFDDFYLNEFDNVRELVPQGFSLRSFFDRLKEKNYRLILATNPFFPINASKTRLEWLGLSTEDFEYITTMENSSYTKPNPKYYENIFDVCGLKAEECLMVGNNPIEDMCAEKLGCKVFLMPEYIENKTNVDCTDFPQGDFDDLEKFIENLEEQK